MSNYIHTSDLPRKESWKSILQDIPKGYALELDPNDYNRAIAALNYYKRKGKLSNVKIRRIQNRVFAISQ